MQKNNDIKVHGPKPFTIHRRPPLPRWATPLVFVLTTLAIVACVIIGNIVGGR